jgi:hypothetical protein
MKNLKIELKNLADNMPILIPVFIILWILGYLLRDIILTNLSIAFLSILLGVYLKEIETRRKIRALKPSILLELKHILISLIENFSRFYMVYFEFLKFLDLSHLFELIKKREKDLPNYLINEVSSCVMLYETHQVYVKKITEEVKKLAKKASQEDIKRIIEKSKEESSWQDALNYFHSLLETYKEIKPVIMPIHMTLLSSILDNLSALDRDFAEIIFYIWREITELNKEIEVLKGLSQTDLSLIRSISQRIETIAIKIDEILEKEGANL